MPFKNYLLRTYGKDTTAFTVGYDRCVEKISRFKNHVAFSARCKKEKVVPPSLRIRSPVDTERGRAIADHASQQFLNERLRVANFRLRELEDERKWREIGLQRRLSSTDYTQVKTMSEAKSEELFLKIRDRQRMKFERFTELTHSSNGCDTSPGQVTDKSRWVLNLSKHTLSDNEQRALERGLNFADCPSKIPTDRFVAGVETALRRCKYDQKVEHARSAVASILRKARPPKANTTSVERQALRELQKNTQITILPADKGNLTVILDTDEYERKAQDLLGNHPFRKVSRNPTRRNEKRVNDGLKRLVDKGAVDKETYDKLCVPGCGSQPPRFYGLVKVHKPDRPLRPVVSAVGSATYKLSKYINRILTPYTKEASSFIENTKHFRERLSEVTIADDEILISFDVRSLFTSVPVGDAIKAVREIVSADPDFQERNGFSVDTFMEMVRICLSTTSFQFRNTHYELEDGLAMGSPLSPSVANIFMLKFEMSALTSCSSEDKPKTWFRFVDDVFSIIREDKARRFLQHLNNQNPAIQFTMELEKDRRLPFLDVTVHRQPDGNLITDTYRKPTHTGRYLHFDSNHPHHVKSAVVTSLLARTENITLSEEAKREEAHRTLIELSANGYPRTFLQRAQRKMQRPKNRAKDYAQKQNEQRDTTSICAAIPYVKGTSEAIRRVLAPLGIMTAFSSKKRKWSLMRGAKDRLSADTQPGVVYALGCADCHQVYIGETGRTAKERTKEHKCHTRMGKTEMSAIAQHVLDTNHQIHWQPRVLVKEQHVTKRKIHEALIIRALDCSMKKTMNQDKGLELSRLWF